MNLEILAVGNPCDELRSEVEALAGSYEAAWYTSLNADRERPAWYLARDRGRLIGFLSVFVPSGQTAEVSAFVEPACRRQGVFAALVNEAQRVWDLRDLQWLLVVDRDDAEGVKAAEHWGTLSHTEYTLGLMVSARQSFGGLPPNLTLKEAGLDDLAAVGRLHAAVGDSDSPDDRVFLKNIVEDPLRCLLVLREHHRIVGAAGLGIAGEFSEIFGLALAPEYQGRGWGKVLVQGLLEIAAGQSTEVRLEVDSTNQRAENLYRSLGFTARHTTDYYRFERRVTHHPDE